MADRGKLGSSLGPERTNYGAPYVSAKPKRRLSKNEQWATSVGLAPKVGDKPLLRVDNVETHNDSFQDVASPEQGIQSWITNIQQEDTTPPNQDFPGPSLLTPTVAVGTANSPCVIVVDESTGDKDQEEFEPVTMSNKGRYMGLPKSDRKLSRVDASSFRNVISSHKFPPHNDNLLNQRKMSALNFYGGQELNDQLLTTNANKSRINVASYAALDRIRDRSRAVLFVEPSQTSLVDSAGGSEETLKTETTETTTTADPEPGTSSSPKKKEQGTLGLGAIVNLRKWRLKSRDKYGQNSKMGFAIDEEHLKFMRSFAKRVATQQIPLPLMIDIYLEVLPILQETVKCYREILGNFHKLTLDAEERTEELTREVTAMMLNM